MDPQGLAQNPGTTPAEADSLGGDPAVESWKALDEAQAIIDAHTPPNVLDEAKALQYGDREDDYGHPRGNYTRIAALWTALLAHKMLPGAQVDPDDAARLMIAHKLSRDVNSPKRDNRVDIAGYALVLDRLETGR